MGGLISVIVPNRDGAEVIGACLRSALAQTWPDFELIVVDDGSTDGSADLIARDFPSATLVRLPAPTGFSGACNAGLAGAKGEWIATLNSDAEADPEWLARAMAAAGDDPTVTMIACRVLAGDGRTVDSLGLMLTAGGLSKLIGHGMPDSLSDHDAPPYEVFGLAGSAALYRRSAIEAAGFFAPELFAYYEDTEMAWRLRAAGGRCLLAPGAVVRHRHSHTAGRVGLDKRYYLQRNRLRTVARNWPAGLILRNLHRLLAVDLASIGVAVMEGRPLSAARARVDFLRALPSDLRARRTPAADVGAWLGRETGGRP